MSAAAAAAAVPLLNRFPAKAFGGPSGELIQSIVQKCFLLTVPVAFIIVLVRERLACAAVLGAARRRAVSRQEIEARLQVVLRDTQLRVSGPSGPETAKVGRVVLPVVSNGVRLGNLDVDRALTLHPTLLQTTIDCCLTALEVQDLQRSVHEQSRALATARRQAADSAATERRRIERDLHDGAHQRLLALTLQLTRLQLDGVGTDQIVERTRGEIKSASAELRDLTHGQGSAAVRRNGLAPSLGRLCDELPIEITLETEPIAQSDDEAEQVAYFVICECLTNVIKHSDSSAARANVRGADGTLVVTVSDRGTGRAHLAPGGGLEGLRERVDRLGGNFVVDATPGVGTRVVARIQMYPPPAVGTPTAPGGRRTAGDSVAVAHHT